MASMQRERFQLRTSHRKDTKRRCQPRRTRGWHTQGWHEVDIPESPAAFQWHSHFWLCPPRSRGHCRRPPGVRTASRHLWTTNDHPPGRV